MGNVRKTGAKFPVVDLTDDMHIGIERIGLVRRSIASRPNQRPGIAGLDKVDSQDLHSNIPIIDLTKDGIPHSNSNVPFIDLTGDDDRPANYRIPVIDLTNDDAMDINDPIECIDLTTDEESNSSPYFDRARNNLYRSTYFTEKMYNTNLPVVDLTYYKEKLDENIPAVIDGNNQDARDTAHQLQHLSFIEDQQQYITNECNPTYLAWHNSQSIHKNIHLISKENYSRPVLDLTSNSIIDNMRSLNLTDHSIHAIDSIRNYTVVGEPLDVEMEDVEVETCNNFPSNIHKNVEENNPRIQIENSSYEAAEYNIFKLNESSQINLTDNVASINNQQNKSIMDETCKVKTCNNNFPTNILKNVDENKSRAQIEDLSYDVVEDIFKLNKSSQLNLTDNVASITNQQNKSSKYIPWTTLPNRDNFYGNDLSSRKYDNTFQNNTSDFLKLAQQPIPFRHSLGRSTVNTSKTVPNEYADASKNMASDFLKPARHPIPFRRSLGRSTVSTSENVPIEYTDPSEGVPRTMTVYSVFHRKMSESGRGISKQNLSNLPEPRANTFTNGRIKELFLKFYIVLVVLLIFFIIWYF